MNSDDLIIQTNLLTNKQKRTEDKRSISPNQIIQTTMGKCNC